MEAHIFESAEQAAEIVRKRVERLGVRG